MQRYFENFSSVDDVISQFEAPQGAVKDEEILFAWYGTMHRSPQMSQYRSCRFSSLKYCATERPLAGGYVLNFSLCSSIC